MWALARRWPLAGVRGRLRMARRDTAATRPYGPFSTPSHCDKLVVVVADSKGSADGWMDGWIDPWLGAHGTACGLGQVLGGWERTVCVLATPSSYKLSGKSLGNRTSKIGLMRPLCMVRVPKPCL